MLERPQNRCESLRKPGIRYVKRSDHDQLVTAVKQPLQRPEVCSSSS